MDTIHWQTAELENSSDVVQLMEDILVCDDISSLYLQNLISLQVFEKIMDCLDSSLNLDIKVQQLCICSLTVIVQISGDITLINSMFKSYRLHVKILEILNFCCEHWDTINSYKYENTVSILMNFLKCCFEILDCLPFNSETCLSFLYLISDCLKKFGLDEEACEFGLLVFIEFFKKSKRSVKESYIKQFLDEKIYQNVFQIADNHKQNDALTECIHSIFLETVEIIEQTRKNLDKKAIASAENYYFSLYNHLKFRLYEQHQVVHSLKLLSKLGKVELRRKHFDRLVASFLHELFSGKHNPEVFPIIMSYFYGTDDSKWLSALFTAMVKFSDSVHLQQAACDALRFGIENNPNLCEMIGEESDCLLPIHNCVIAALNIHKKDIYLFQSACGAIHTLSTNSPIIQESYVMKGVYISIINEIVDSPGDNTIQGCGFHALRGLACNHLLQKELMFQYHILLHIESTLKETADICVLKECIGLVACLAQDLEDFRKQCMVYQLPLIILDIMSANDANEDLVEVILETLALFTSYEENQLLKIVFIEKIHCVVKHHQSNERINLKACIIMQLIAGHKDFIGQKDVFGEIVDTIKDAILAFSSNSSVKVEGCVALSLLLAECSYDKYKVIGDSNIHENLLFIFETSDPLLSVLAQYCLSSLTFEQSITNIVFQRACLFGLKNCCKLLIEWGADVNSSSEEGSALCLAVSNNQIEIVELLLTFKPSDVSSALQCALEKKLHNVAGILLRHIGFEETHRAITWSALNICYLKEEYFLPSLLQRRKATSSMVFDVESKNKSNSFLLCENKTELKEAKINRRVKFLAVSKLPFNCCDPRHPGIFCQISEPSGNGNIKRLAASSVNLNPTQKKNLFQILSLNDNDECIVTFDISHNQISDIENLAISTSFTMKNFLKNLVTLDVSNNSISDFSLPLCSSLLSLKTLRASKNNLKQLPYDLLNLQKIEDLDIASNYISSIEPDKIPVTLSIQKLDLSDNQLNTFPLCFQHKFPRLQHLFLSKNGITDLPLRGEFASLQTLHLSFNKLTNIPNYFLDCCISLEKLDFSHNYLESLPTYTSSTLLQLTHLYLSHNKLTHKDPFYIPKFVLDLPSLIYLDMSNNSLTCLPDLHYWSSKKIKELNFSNNSISELPLNKNAGILWPNIFSLILSNNKIKVLPSHIGKLNTLSILDVSHNKMLKKLPDEIGQLNNLFQFPMAGLTLRHGAAVLNGTPKNLVSYFRSKLENSVPYRHIKLMLVGLAGRGKTSLICQLSKKPHSANKLATVGIEVKDFILKPPQLKFKSSSKYPSFLVNAWDFAGQEDFYSTHQFFLSSRALYLAVYDASRGEEEIKTLTPWLLNIQAAAPGSKVILVGTHADKCAKENLQSLSASHRKFLQGSGFPTIQTTAIVNCLKENHGIVLLREEIYKCISEFMFKGQPILEKMVPQSYVKFESFIRNKAKTMRISGELPIISKQSLHQLSIENGLQLDHEEFNRVLMFLAETGSLFNFKDPIGNLKNYCIIDPQWFCQMMARVVTIKEINPYITQRGVLAKSDALKLFPEPCFTQNFLELFFRLLQRFEVLLPISEENYLVTSKLQKASPQHLLMLKQNWLASHIITRRYHFPYVPSGFWPRLIARVLSFPELIHGSYLQLNLESDYWQNGVFLKWSQTSFCLIESDENNLNIFDIYSQRSFAGYQLFVGIVDLVDALIDEWYPGLTDTSLKRTVKRLAPCHNCKILGKEVYFELEKCIEASYLSDKIKCTKCSTFCDISFIAPDAVFADLGDLVNSNCDIKYLDNNNKLGTGAFASVYKVKINGNYVAAKVFTKSPGSCPNRMLRQEVDILKRLHHPCLVSVVGVSLRPRALLLEYAPLGSLASALTSKRDLSKGLKHRIALQIAEGLAFIHKHNIVYRDLKPSNVLVFSYSLCVPVNVKLSDYGISQLKAFQGLIAIRGTATYQAPEVACADSEYSTEVDIFSYGVTLYELVTNGQKPFRDLKFQNEFENAILSNKPIDSLISHGCAPWPDIEDLIKNCLLPTPEKRPKAETLVEALLNVDLLCLKKQVAVCKKQNIECLTTRTFSDSEKENIEVWVASGGSGLNSQLTWFSVTQTRKHSVQGTMTRVGRILCMMSYKHCIIVGTKECGVALYDAQSKCFMHELAQLSDSVLCMLQTQQDSILFGLADGKIAIFRSDDIFKTDSVPQYISLNDKNSRNPIICMALSHENLICGYGKDIKILDTSSFVVLQTAHVTNRSVNAVSCVIYFQSQLILSSKKSSKLVVVKYVNHRVNESLLFEFDCSKTLKKNYPNISEHDCRIISLELVDNSSLWIGCGGGHVLIVDILKPLFQVTTVISRHLGAVRSIISTQAVNGKPASVITAGQGFRPLLAFSNDVEEFGFVLLWDADLLKLKKHLITEKKNRDELLSKISAKSEKYALRIL